VGVGRSASIWTVALGLHYTGPVNEQIRTLASPGMFAGTARFSRPRILGSGSAGTVYRVHDAELGTDVALKVLHGVSVDDLIALKQEFRSLVDIAHPNLVCLHELIVEDAASFFTMDLVEGPDFLDYVRAASGSARIDRLTRSLAQLALGVSALHEAGRLHRDLKPSNILVTARGRVVVLDFGLVTTKVRGRFGAAEGELAGTVAYMAPEQVFGTAVAASDWYSVGVIAYEAITGALPHAGDAAAMVNARLRAAPPPPRGTDIEVPDTLVALITALLQPRPEERPDGAEVLRALRAALTGRLAVPAAGGARGDDVFVGRQPELRCLEAALDDVRVRRQPAIVCLEGPSGIGKSSLLHRFLDGAEADGNAVVLRGRCHIRECVPYKALDRVIDGLSRLLNAQPELLVDGLGECRHGDLVRLFPVLARIPGVTSPHDGPEDAAEPREARRRGIAALRELLSRVARDRPIVIAIDDFQWSDADSSVLIDALVQPPQAPSLLFVLAYRTDGPDGTGGTELPRNCNVARVSVEPFGAAETLELARSLCPHAAADAHVLGDIVRESGGSPFLVAQMARMSTAGRSSPEAVSSVGEVITSRVRHLPGAGRRLLEIVAVAGVPIDRSLALGAAGLDERERVRVGLLEQEGLVRSSSIGGRVRLETYHDRVRESVVGLLPAATRRQRHRALADAWRERGGADAETLFVHYREAGDVAAAGSYAVTAAEDAERALAFDRAGRLYDQALTLGAGDRGVLLARAGDALANAGRGGEAAERLLAAAGEKSIAPRARRALRRRAAEQFLRNGFFDQGMTTMRAVLADVGLALPRTPRAAALAAIAQHARLAWRGFALLTPSSGDDAHDFGERLDACWVAAISLSVVNPILGEPFAIRHLILALNRGDRERAVRAVGYEAARAAAIGGPIFARRSRRLLAMVEDLARTSERAFDQAWLRLATGSAAYFRGDYAAALQHIDAALEVWRSRCRGVWWEIVTAESFAVTCLARLGRMRELSRRLPTAVADVDARGDVYGSIGLRGGLPNLAWLASDEPAEAHRQADAAIAWWPDTRTFHVQHYLHLQATVHADLYVGDAQAAWRRVETAWPRVRASGLLRVSSARVDLGAIRARAALAAAMGADGARRRRLLRIAAHEARKLSRERSRPARGDALLIRAAIALARGDDESAAVDAARATEELAASSIDVHAVVAKALEARIRSRDWAEQEDALRAMGVAQPRRLAAVVAPGAF
jgi:tetratricopeptide (TPR) repeat protein